MSASTTRVAIRVTGQLADAIGGIGTFRAQKSVIPIGDFACLLFVLLAASGRPRVVQSAKCPVRELAYPRVVQLPL